MKDKTTTLVTARGARRVVDFPEYYGGGYDLISGRRTAQPQIAKSPYTYACLQIRGQELANVPWHIKRGDKILDKHVLINMLREFGDESNYIDSMAATEMDRLAYGAAFWVKDAGQLRRLSPDTMKVNTSKAGITGFTQTIEGKEEHFKRDDIVYFREYHPEDDLGFGIPVTEVCKRSIATEIEALLMIEAHFKNDAIPGFLLVSDQDIPPEEADRVLSWWNKRFRGSRNKSKVGVAGRGLKPHQVGSSMKDNALVELLDNAHSDICVAFRVPKLLVGSQTEATYVNLAESRKFLIEEVIIPRAIDYAATINHDLVQKVDKSVEFEFAFDELQILQEDTTAKWARLKEGLEKGLISEDYAREEMGYPQSAKPPETDKPEVQAEKSWEKKAIKAVIKGDSADVPFETDVISVDRQYVLHGRLKNAKTKEDVKECFK